MRLRHRGKKRMLMVVNPYATTVSDRLKNLVVYALQGRYEVEAIQTEAQNHAIEIGRGARDGRYDVVVAFSGDGTLNEVANGLAGSDVPLTMLPGGSTNVVCRTLGIPNNVVDATEHLLSLADDWAPRKIDLGKVDERYFVFSCGAGIDATVVKRVDANPKLKAKAGPYYYSWTAVSTFYRNYLHKPVRMRVEAEGHDPVEGITALAQNSDPFTYFASMPDQGLRGHRDRRRHALDGGPETRRAAPHAVADGAAPERSAFPLPRHRQIVHLDDVTEATITSISEDRQGRRPPLPGPGRRRLHRRARASRDQRSPAVAHRHRLIKRME